MDKNSHTLHKKEIKLTNNHSILQQATILFSGTHTTKTDRGNTESGKQTNRHQNHKPIF